MTQNNHDGGVTKRPAFVSLPDSVSVAQRAAAATPTVDQLRDTARRVSTTHCREMTESLGVVIGDTLDEYGDWLPDAAKRIGNKRLPVVAAQVTDGGSPGTEEAYADDTPLTWIMGGGPKVKIVASMLSEPDSPVSCDDVADISGVDPELTCEHLDTLDDYGLVHRETGKSGKRSYVLNTDDDVVQHLASAERKLLERWYQEQYQGGS